MKVHCAIAVRVAQDVSAVGKFAALAVDAGRLVNFFFGERGGGDNDLKRLTWLDHVDDRPVFHLFRLGLPRAVRVKIWPVGHG